jgi:hypothetical protein
MKKALKFEADVEVFSGIKLKVYGQLGLQLKKK